MRGKFGLVWFSNVNLWPHCGLVFLKNNDRHLNLSPQLSGCSKELSGFQFRNRDQELQPVLTWLDVLSNLKLPLWTLAPGCLDACLADSWLKQSAPAESTFAFSWKKPADFAAVRSLSSCDRLLAWLQQSWWSLALASTHPPSPHISTFPHSVLGSHSPARDNTTLPGGDVKPLTGESFQVDCKWTQLANVRPERVQWRFKNLCRFTLTNWNDKPRAGVTIAQWETFSHSEC